MVGVGGGDQGRRFLPRRDGRVQILRCVGVSEPLSQGAPEHGQRTRTARVTDRDGGDRFPESADGCVHVRQRAEALEPHLQHEPENGQEGGPVRVIGYGGQDAFPESRSGGEQVRVVGDLQALEHVERLRHHPVGDERHQQFRQPGHVGDVTRGERLGGRAQFGVAFVDRQRLVAVPVEPAEEEPGFRVARTTTRRQPPRLAQRFGFQHG